MRDQSFPSRSKYPSYTANIRMILITAEYVVVYSNTSAQPPSSRVANTANALITALS